MVILVRYGELALKSKPVRKRFEDTLMKNIVDSLNNNGIDCIVSSKRGRIFIFTNNEEESIEKLKKIFGIVSVSIAKETSSDLEEICKLSVELSKKIIKKHQSFAIRTTRTGQHKYSSQEAAAKIGEAVLNNNECSVNLSNPDITIFVEIRDNKAFIYSEKIYCIGGFPLGTQGKALSLISDGESIISTWLIMKRGCKIIPIINKNLDIKQLEILTKWGGVGKPIIVEIHDKKNENLDEYFENINEIAIETKTEAIILNDKNPKKCNFNYDKNLNIPIFRPLIGLNDSEIDILSKKIGLN